MPRWSADGNAVNPAPSAMTRTSVAALGGPDLLARFRCPYCLVVRPVVRLNLDHQERCELRPTTTEAG